MRRNAFSLVSLLLLLSLLTSACVAPAPADSTTSSTDSATTDVMTDTTTMTDSTSADTTSREGWPEVFRVGFFGGDDADETMESNEPFRLYMEERLGIPVELFTGTSYTAVIEAM
ncbi:MAG: PhnD/SsuA/transferrin family substrate-binding protein, partial [Caldilineaceae bacterium]|nr:PhnD/SsuA/transferrin family substrate-binding protein [Caldilineaceae bacterium]